VEDSVEMCHVIWSEPDRRGRYLMVGHYRADRIGTHLAERHAQEFNEQKRTPWEFEAYVNGMTRGE